jgi:hypothetical protein
MHDVGGNGTTITYAGRGPAVVGVAQAAPGVEEDSADQLADVEAMVAWLLAPTRAYEDLLMNGDFAGARAFVDTMTIDSTGPHFAREAAKRIQERRRDDIARLSAQM